MWKIDLYETPAGNIPVEKYIDWLVSENKDEEVKEVMLYVKKLIDFGPNINKNFRANATKLLRDDIYELRPSASRIFFFFYDNDGTYVLLHGYEKKTKKTDPKEIKKAIKEKNNYMRRKKK